MGLGDLGVGGRGHIDAWNDTATSYPHDRSIAELFAQQVGHSPDAVALSSGERRVTYAELDQWSDRLAARLVAAGVRVGEPVGLLGERCLEAPVGMLAILKAGAAYVPLDRADPIGRLRALVDELEIRRVVATPGCGELLDRIPHFLVADLRFGDAPRLPAVQIGGADLAYVMFTSGSTGRPKAIAVPHRGVVRLVINTDYISFAPSDRVANTGSHSFDASVFEIWGALLNGACLVVVDQDTLLDPRRLDDFLRQEAITILWLSAGLFHHCARTRPTMFAGLRCLITGADVLIPDLVRRVLRGGPPGRLINAYGPTENSTISTTHLVTDVPAGVDRIPIGRPIANSSCYIVTAGGALADIGEEGELVVGGDGVALGYVNDPEATADRFVPDTYGRRAEGTLFRTGDIARWQPDGVIEFIGRRDRMIKLRGFRVELDEIEAVLATCPMVGDVAVTVDGDDPDSRTIVGYFTPVAGADVPTPAQLRAFLAQRLSAHMLPGRFIQLEQLPLTSSGKPDRAALAAAAAATAAGVAPAPIRRPTTPEQVGLARLWEELLDAENVGLDDTFFELGGNSLFAARIFARLQTMFGIGPEQGRFLTRRLLLDPSLHACAEAIRDARAGTLRAAEATTQVDFRRESTLDVPIPAAVGGVGARPSGNLTGGILLTGATGFVGSYLLRELLDATDVKIYCLVRAVDAEHAMRRLDAAQSRYELGAVPRDRVVPLVGDLSSPLLGLTAEDFDRYACRLDLVLHAGAYVNFTYPYSQLAPATVGGTKEIIRLACRYRRIPVHFVSTIAVLAGFGAAGVGAVTENTPIAFPEHLYMGYTETKWVAEAVLGAAAQAGLPVGIYRPYEVSGDLHRGAWNLESATCALFKVMVDSGSVPDIDLALDFVPVDLLARQIVHIVLTRTAVTGTYNLANPHPATLHDMADRLRAHGYQLQLLPLADWIQRVVELAAADPDHRFAPFVPMWVDRSPRSGLLLKEMYFVSHFPRFASTNAEAALADADISIPPVDADMLDHYIRFFQRSGFIRRPPTGP